VIYFIRCGNKYEHIYILFVPYLLWVIAIHGILLVQFKDCQVCTLNEEDAMDHSRWRKLIKDVWWSRWLWVCACFFWYRPTRAVTDKGPLSGCRWQQRLFFGYHFIISDVRFVYKCCICGAYRMDCGMTSLRRTSSCQLQCHSVAVSSRLRLLPAVPGGRSNHTARPRCSCLLAARHAALITRKVSHAITRCAAGCLEISWNLKLLLKIWNLVDAAGEFYN